MKLVCWDSNVLWKKHVFMIFKGCVGGFPVVSFQQSEVILGVTSSGCLLNCILKTVSFRDLSQIIGSSFQTRGSVVLLQAEEISAARIKVIHESLQGYVPVLL